jgi:hypothetical protein
MRQLDRYDIAGLVIVALLIALWIAHFTIPSGGPPADLPH